MDLAHWSIVLTGLLAVVFSVLAAVVASRRHRKLKAVSSAVRSSAREAVKAAGTAVGGAVDLTGTAFAEEPLISPVTGTQCVYYRYKIKELQESEYDYVDSDGYRRTGTDRSWRTIKDEGSYTPFVLRDATGSIPVDAAEAEFIGDEHDSQLDSWHQLWECVIPTGKPVYVIGSVARTASGPVLRKTGDETLIVSSKSDREVGSSLAFKTVAWGMAAAAALVAGGGAIAYAFINRTRPFQGDAFTAGVLLAAAVFLGAIVFAIYCMTPRYKGVVFKGTPAGEEAWGGSAEMPGNLLGEAPRADAESVPAAPSEEATPAAPAEASPAAPVAVTPGARPAVIQRDIVIDGLVAFRAGERILVEAESPDANRPEYRYVVFSKPLNRRYRLSDLDVFL